MGITQLHHCSHKIMPLYKASATHNPVGPLGKPPPDGRSFASIVSHTMTETQEIQERPPASSSGNIKKACRDVEKPSGRNCAVEREELFLCFSVEE